MAIASPILIQLGLSFIIATLKLIIEPNNFNDGIIFILKSPNRNISFNLKNGIFYADSMAINRKPFNSDFKFIAKCINDFALKIEVDSEFKVIPSPSLCKKDSKNGKLIF